MTLSSGEILKFQQKYQGDPVGFMVDCLDVKKENVWDKMEEVAIAVRDNQHVAVKAGNSVSKSYVVSRLALWFLYCFYPSTVVTTAPSFTQVEEILWREIATAHSNAKIPLGGKLTKTQLDLQSGKGEKWFAIGFATKPDTVTQQATRVQGFHNVYVLVIFDEGAGVVKPIWEAKDKLITSPLHKFIAIGNPTVAQGDFVDCFKSSSFKKITISVKDTPNYKQGKEVIPGLAGCDFEAKVINKYGLDSDHYKAMITGEIPEQDVDSLIPINWVEKAEDRTPFRYKFKKRFVTWDVADGGRDPHMLKAWENKTEIDSQAIYGKKVEEAEPYVWRMLRKIDGNCIIVDGDGVGRVAVGLLDQAKDKRVQIINFMGSDKDLVIEPDIFLNRRHEGYWALREDYRENRISVIPNEEAKEEVTNIKTVRAARGLIAIEKKEVFKVRIGRSPNHADCQMMMSSCFDEVKVIERKRDVYEEDEVNQIFTPETL